MGKFVKQTVVIPVDFSDKSIQAVEEGLSIVEDPTKVHVIHVLPELSATEPGVVWESVTDESRCEHTEKSLREQFDDPKFTGMTFAVAIGDPGSEIVKFAETIKADLIALPSHGRTGLSRLLIGSVAERVSRLAHCPVLVLRS